MKTLRSIVHSRSFNIFVEGAILVSLVTFPFETLDTLGGFWHRWLRDTELFIIVFFTIEYVLRIVTEPKPLRYIFSINGIVDMLSFFPYYLVGADFRVIRIFRLFRLFRLAGNSSYASTMRKFRQAFMLMREELVVFLMISLSLLYVSATVIYYFEHEAQPEAFSSMFDGIWWSIITLTTTGYGDLYPITLMGKVFTTIMLIVGVGIIIIPSSLFAASFHKVNNRSHKKQ